MAEAWLPLHLPAHPCCQSLHQALPQSAKSLRGTSQCRAFLLTRSALSILAGTARERSARQRATRVYRITRTHIDGQELEHPVLRQDRHDRLLARLSVSVYQRQPSCMRPDKGGASRVQLIVWMNRDYWRGRHVDCYFDFCGIFRLSLAMASKTAFRERVAHP